MATLIITAILAIFFVIAYGLYALLKANKARNREIKRMKNEIA